MFNPLKKPSRLGQWNGRRRSTRGDDPVWPYLGRRPVLLRLAVVVLTTAAVTGIACLWGPPMPYRIGEVYPYDLRVRADFELVNEVELITQPLPGGDEAPPPPPAPPPVGPGRPGKGHKPVVRESARSADRPVLEKYPRGVVLVPRGQPISERQLALLKEEHRAFERSIGAREWAWRGLALFLIFSLLASLVVLYVARFHLALARSLPTIAGLGLLAVATIVLSMLASVAPWYAVFLPLTVTALILTLVYNPQFALLMSVSLALATVVALGIDLGHLLVLLSGLSTAVLLLRNVRTRTGLVRVTAGAGLAYLVMTVASGILSGQTWNLIAADAARRFVWGTLAGFLLTGLLPVVERVFGIITDISLLELADGSHALLQELVRRAPGTYTHSMTVATLAEGAADTIGANPLLTRVGAYFHDVGKMLKPHYFIENQGGENRHDALEPALSTLIIIGHVKDGVALARQYNLPQPVVDFIEQHHGTTLIEYFYREALRLQEANGQGSGELEPSFRYPGPKPQSRENGILMLADAVESASRALHDPTPGRLRKLVHDLLMKRLLDAQFEASGLTLTELHLIEESLCKSLIALFHARIRYPEEQLQPKAS
jgi:putative nucleotidyltransferase with HDIG domain